MFCFGAVFGSAAAAIRPSVTTTGTVLRAFLQIRDGCVGIVAVGCTLDTIIPVPLLVLTTLGTNDTKEDESDMSSR